MSLLKRWFGNKPSTQPHKPQPKSEPTGRGVARDPVLYADWLNEYIILGQPLERELDLSPFPSAGSCISWVTTYTAETRGARMTFDVLERMIRKLWRRKEVT